MEFFAVFLPALIGLVVCVLLLVAQWKVYSKAGQPGWAMLIPIYNIIVLLRIVGKPWWWILLFIIPGVNVVFMIWTLNLLSLSFGKSAGFTIGMLFLSVIFLPILGLGSAKYVGPAGMKKDETACE